MDSLVRCRQRRKYWDDLAGLTAELERTFIDDNDASEALAIDPSIYPRFPTTFEVLKRYDQQSAGQGDPEMRKVLQSKCAQLQRHVRDEYRSSIARMVSLQRTAGISDQEVQRQYSKHVEQWYDKAERDILETFVANKAGRSSVRDPRRQ